MWLLRGLACLRGVYPDSRMHPIMDVNRSLVTGLAWFGALLHDPRGEPPG